MIFYEICSIFLLGHEARGNFRFEKKLDWSCRPVCPSSRTRLAFTSLQLHVKHSIFLINHEFRLRRIRLLIFSLVIHTSPLLGLIYSSMTCPTNVEEWASYLKGLTLVYSLHFIQNKTIDCWLIASTWILGGWLVRRCCCRNSKQIQRFRFFSSVDGWSIKYPYSNPRIFC